MNSRVHGSFECDAIKIKRRAFVGSAAVVGVRGAAVMRDGICCFVFVMMLGEPRAQLGELRLLHSKEITGPLRLISTLEAPPLYSCYRADHACSLL